MTDDITIHFFELPKFKLRAEDVKTPLEAWLYFLRYAERLDPENLPEEIATPEIRQAMERLMQLTRIDIQKEIYEGRLKAQRDALALNNAVAQAEKALAQAEAERAEVEKALAQAEKAMAQAENERAQAENERAQAQNERAQAEGRVADLEALAKGSVVARIQLMQTLLRRSETPTADLERMTLESLTALAGQLEREMPR